MKTTHTLQVPQVVLQLMDAEISTKECDRKVYHINEDVGE